MKQIILVVAMASLLFGCVTSYPLNTQDQILLISGVYQEGHNIMEPKPATSRYYKTVFGGFKSFDNTAGYVLTAEIHRRPTKRLYTKCVIENPKDPKQPFIYTHYIDPSSPVTNIEHGPVDGLQIYKDYIIELIVYDDEERTKEVDKLVQKIRSYVDTTGPVLQMKNGMEK